jgi:hypothetical protein
MMKGIMRHRATWSPDVSSSDHARAVATLFHWDDEFSELVACRLHCALARISARLASPHGGNHQAGDHAL